MNLTGKNFQQAHQALCEKKRKHTRHKHLFSKKDVFEAVAIAVGILIAFWGLCSFARETHGNGWHVGDYRAAPAWND